jgi:hypothetical protein
MANEKSTIEEKGSTVVTRVTGKKDTDVHPMMSYTAVTSHREMAVAFVRELIRHGNRIMNDHELTIEDLVTICHLALAQRETGVLMLEGRHLRARVSEQISRADRYKEPFSLMFVKLNASLDRSGYDSVVDTLCERMRKTDMMFIFKSRLALILPHTLKEPCGILATRIQQLLETAVASGIIDGIPTLTYPDPEITARSQVLDWAEDQLRD